MEEYEPFLQNLVRRFRFSGVDKEDLLQEARIALLEAARKHDEARSQLTTIAYPRILWRLAAATRRATYKTRRGERKYRRGGRVSTVSLDQPIGVDGESTLHDVLGVPATQEEQFANKEVVEVAMSALTWRQKVLVRTVAEEPDLTAAAKRLSVHPETARRQFKSALEMMRRKVAA